MEEIEKSFRCPYCLQKISMLLDTSIEETQSYIEDCEVCCQPIQISFVAESSKIRGFRSEKVQG